MLFQIILAVELGLMLLIRRVFQVLSMQAGIRQYYDQRAILQFQTALNTLAMFATAMVALSPNLLAWAALPFPAWLRWAGVLIGALGVGLLLWSHTALGRNFFGGLSIKEDHRLISDGPYHWVRHPMYTSLFGISVGFTLLSANWLVGLLWLVLMIQSIGTRVSREEAMMLAEFGEDYARYMQQTGRFLPGL